MKEFFINRKIIAAAVLALGAVATTSLLTGCGGEDAVAATQPDTSSGITVNRIDLIRGDAPELAAYGDQKVGVRTLDLVNPNQIDVASITTFNPLPDPLPRYDRPLKVEVWYPADANATGTNQITAMMRNGELITLQGKAIQNAAPKTSGGAYPLVILSHGHPGNRHLMSPIAENIASKGYVVVAIDHIDSTYNTLGANGLDSALVNRPLDQLFVLNKIASLVQDSSSFLHGLANPDNTALIGYSMGGYGTLVTLGAGINQATATAKPLTAQHLSGSASHLAMADSRIKTAVTFAPAGTKHGWIDNSALADIKVPLLFIAGSVDATVGYEDGVRATWANTTSVNRSLLTFVGAGHNVGAPMSPPLEAYKFDSTFNMYLTNHYTDPVWDNLRMNNISQHFITAWLGKHLKADTNMDAYMDLAVDSDATWKGFASGTAKSLKFEKLSAGQ